MKKVLLALFLTTNCIAADDSTSGRYTCDVTLSKLVEGEYFKVWTIERAGTVVNKNGGVVYNVKGGVNGSTGKMRRFDRNDRETFYASKIGMVQEEQFFRYDKNGLIFQYNSHPRKKSNTNFSNGTIYQFYNCL